jgi:DNA-binding transcriptional MerR regulator
MKNSFQKTVLTVADVARIANCHRSTVLRYEDKGVLLAKRDTNNFRRYSLEDALRLKDLLSTRRAVLDQYSEAYGA